MRKIWSPTILLPPVLEQDDRLAAAKAALEYQLRLVSEAALECILYPRLDELDELVLDMLANQYHVDFYEPIGMDIETKRALIKDAILWHRRKGTPAAVEEIVRHVYRDAHVSEWFEYGGEPYFFRIIQDVSDDTEPTDRTTLDRLRLAVAASKNARSWLEYFQFIVNFEDTVEPPDEAIEFDVSIGAWDEYEYRRVAFLFDGSVPYDASSIYGGFQAPDFEQWFFDVRLLAAETVEADEEQTFDVSLSADDSVKPQTESQTFDVSLSASDTVEPAEDHRLALFLSADETVETEEDQTFDVSLSASDTVEPQSESQTFDVSLSADESVLIAENHRLEISLSAAETVKPDETQTFDVTLSASETVSPAEDAWCTITQHLLFDGVINYDGAFDYRGTFSSERINLIVPDELERWEALRAELESDFDEPCTCGSTSYLWHRSSVRLNAERFTWADPQLITVQIRCADCGDVIAEYIVPDPEWEVLL